METLSIPELSHIFAEIPFNRMLGLKVDSIEEKRIVMSFVMKPELIGNFMHGILHGGVISSVIDMAGGVAALSAVMRKHQSKNLTELKELLGKASTINLHINYVYPGKGDSFTVTSWVVRSGNKICFTQSELHNEAKTLIASGAGTYLVG